MSAPSFLISYDEDGNENGRISHNWGWFSPTEQEVAIKIVRMVESISRGAGDLVSGQLGPNWAVIQDRYYGRMTREKYYDMYDMMKSIHYGLTDPSKFKLEDYFDGCN